MDISSASTSLFAGLGGMLPSREDFLKSLSQHARLLTLVCPLPEASLLVEQMRGREAVSEDFQFEIQCLASSAHLELKALIGEELTLRVLLADGRSSRSWHGLVTAATQLGSDGALARYALKLQPWTACMALRRNSRIFQDKSVEDIAREVFADYPAGAFEFRLSETLPLRSLCAQYRETDQAFLARLFASEGLSFYFEHLQDEAASGELAHTRHKLIIVDGSSEAPESRQPLVRFHRNNATEASDSIQTWQSARSLGSNAATLASWDYRQLLAPAASSDADFSAQGGAGDLPRLEDYDASGAYRFSDQAAAERSVRLHTAFMALSGGANRSTGSVRQLEAGSSFTLTQNPSIQGEAARQRVLIVEHEASNNLDSEARAAGAQARIERGIYRNRAVSVPLSLPLVPRPLPKPAVPGLQTALVVGTQNAQALGTCSERDGRVRIQFHWQRGQQPNLGGLAHDTERATGELGNGTWVRVAEALAGANWGSHFTPRIGSEVLVDFHEGDIDRPVIVAALHNGQDEVPWPAGEAANHSGVVAGIHAPTLDGNGWSQWQIDDATGQLRTRLASSAFASQLNLGHLIHHSPSGSQRGAGRGQGFELRTDGWQIQRAAKGMLISATARQNAGSIQLDTTEAAGQLKAANDTAQRLSDAATQSEADALAQAQKIEAFRQRIHPEAPPPDGNARPDRELKPFEGPALLMEAPASIALATPASTTLFAGEHLSATIQGDTQLTAQHTASFVSGDATSLYTHAGGIKAIAANSPLSLQSHNGPLEVLADQNVTVTSSNDEIHVLANSKIVLQAGQSSITLEGANITFACPGKFMVKGAQHVMASGAASAASLGALPSGAMGAVASNESQDLAMPSLAATTYDTHYLVKSESSGEPMANVRYCITLSDGRRFVGTTDENGLTEKVTADRPLLSTIQVPFNDANATSPRLSSAKQQCSC
ncbi:type VI secretion system Vgr family protein [Uliginosibacterium sp. 31-12]|uniref:type VI secretion system Vgr family protein n=1 Tax=Uliginosibacterium sp. 31-12 TaxID=3062781 RepID=UPI0026E24C48|nr:type VI secretion system tip protein TssI/VgrG [Uliginosibacterium sp. 31-12]MDO6388421.1 type VI secretion system tip protein TssI/VgrG [Uliginosibacterium sp. 31-12]